jgi:16S rRNA processing protein RimM
LNKSAPKKDVVLIGKIVGTHGVKGTCKIQSFADSLAVFEPGETLLVRRPDGSENSYEIIRVKPHSRGALLTLKDVANREQAKTLIGTELYIDRARLPKLDNGTYYWFDLIGLKVYTTEDRYIGRLDSIIETGANDVYVVKKEDREILIPALKSVVRVIDTEQKTMQVDLPEGLEEH